jgi:hypothetical protein
VVPTQPSVPESPLSAYLARFAHVICTANESDIRSNVTLGGRLIIECACNLEASREPFEHIEQGVRIAIVGITSGALQAANALCEVRRLLLA